MVEVKLFRSINAEAENAPYLPKGRPTNFNLCMEMEYDDPHHQRARWRQRSKVKVTRPFLVVVGHHF